MRSAKTGDRLLRPTGRDAAALQAEIVASDHARLQEIASHLSTRFRSESDAPKSDLLWYGEKGNAQPGDILVRKTPDGQSVASLVGREGSLSPLSLTPKGRFAASPGYGLARRIPGTTEADWRIADELYRQCSPVIQKHESPGIRGYLIKETSRKKGDDPSNTNWSEPESAPEPARSNNSVSNYVSDHLDFSTRFEGFIDGRLTMVTLPKGSDETAGDLPRILRSAHNTDRKNIHLISQERWDQALMSFQPVRSVQEKRPFADIMIDYLSSRLEKISPTDSATKDVGTSLSQPRAIATNLEFNRGRADRLKIQLGLRSLADKEVLATCDRLQKWDGFSYNKLADANPERRRNLLDAARAYPLPMRAALHWASELGLSTVSPEKGIGAIAFRSVEDIAAGKTAAEALAVVFETTPSAIRRLHGITPSMISGTDALRRARWRPGTLIEAAGPVPIPQLPRKRVEWDGLMQAFENHKSAGLKWNQANIARCASNWTAAPDRVPSNTVLNDAIVDVARRLSGLVQHARSHANLENGARWPKNQADTAMITDWIVGNGDPNRLGEFSDRWHRAQAKILDALPEGNRKWAPLLPIGETPNGLTYEFLTDEAALKVTGRDQGHCVGGYTRACLQSSHIAVLRDKERILATVEFMEMKESQTKGGSPTIKIQQCMAANNKNPHKSAITAALWIAKNINSENIKPDWHLVQEMRSRANAISNNQSDITARTLLSFDPVDQPETCNQLFRIYQDVLPRLRRYKDLAEFAASKDAEPFFPVAPSTKKDDFFALQKPSGQYVSELRDGRETQFHQVQTTIKKFKRNPSKDTALEAWSDLGRMHLQMQIDQVDVAGKLIEIGKGLNSAQLSILAQHRGSQIVKKCLIRGFLEVASPDEIAKCIVKGNLHLAHDVMAETERKDEVITALIRIPDSVHKVAYFDERKLGEYNALRYAMARPNVADVPGAKIWVNALVNYQKAPKYAEAIMNQPSSESVPGFEKRSGISSMEIAEVADHPKGDLDSLLKLRRSPVQPNIITGALVLVKTSDGVGKILRLGVSAEGKGRALDNALFDGNIEVASAMAKDKETAAYVKEHQSDLLRKFRNKGPEVLRFITEIATNQNLSRNRNDHFQDQALGRPPMNHDTGR